MAEAWVSQGLGQQQRISKFVAQPRFQWIHEPGADCSSLAAGRQ
jgi:hypothetical protein